MRDRFASLTSRLIVTAVALVAVISLLIGAATTLAVRSYLTGQLDDNVQASLARAQHAPAFGGQPPGVPGQGDADDQRGQGVGTLTVKWDTHFTKPTTDVLVDGGNGYPRHRSLSAPDLSLIDNVEVDGAVHEVHLSGYGSYRIVVAPTPDGKIAAGLPTHDVDTVVSKLVVWETLLILFGSLFAAAAGVLVVRRQLRPLREVAATAHTVAGLPLATGEIELADRVPERLTDERTEVGQVGSALNTLLAHVESSLTARHQSELQVRQFVADASHELRSPLTTIAGYTELARRRPDDPDTVRTAIGKVEEESARMTSLVEDMLLLARLDSGRPLERGPVDLSRLLVEAVSDARVVAPEHKWRLDLPEHSVEVTGDAARLHQVITNLLTNARKYTPAGTTVTVQVQPHGFSVQDDGPGFAPEVRDKAFERFARGNSARTRGPDGGAGLGLALVQAIVTAHAGRVRLDSGPGATTITVDLPAA